MSRKNKRNKALLTAFATLAMASSAFAIPRGPCDPKPADICCEEPAPGPFAFSYPKDVGLACPRDFYFDASFLLMQATEEGLEYGIQQSYSSSSNPESYPLQGGEIESLSSENSSSRWNLGARIGLGCYLNHDQWDVNATWTYIHFKHDEGITLSNGVMLPTWPDPGLTPSIDHDSCSARWSGNLHAIDFKIGKPYHISRYVIFSPNFGVKFGWIDQDYLSRNGELTDGTTTCSNVDMDAENKFWGVGLRAGLDTNWSLSREWSIFANIAAALMYAHFDVNQHVTFGTSQRTDLKHEYDTTTPTSEIQVGLCWTKLFNKTKNLVRLKAGYEFQAWFDQNHLRRFYSSTNVVANSEVSRGNLFFNGFAFSVGFEF